MSNLIASSNLVAAAFAISPRPAASGSVTASYGLTSYIEESEPLADRMFRYAGVAAFHAGLLLLFLAVEPRLQENLTPTSLDVRTIVEEITPPAPPKPEVVPPKPLPQARQVTRPAQLASPIMTAASSEPSPAAFAVAPQPPSVPLASPVPSAPPAPVATPAAPPVTAARFDADYLKNPPPAYPALSRRVREEGKVLLLVQVSANGMATDVRVRQSSGSARLDDAALEAVRQWRFVPAKRGDEAIAASVVVPIVFRIE